MRIALLRRLSLLLPALAVSLLAACGSGDRDESVPHLGINEPLDAGTGEPAEFFEVSRTFSENIILSGEVEPGASVEVAQTTTTETGKKIPLAESDPAMGTWSAAIVLERGVNTVTVTGIDKAGNSNRIRMDMVLADVMVTPANGASNVPLETVITAVFRNPITGVPPGSFQLFLASDSTNQIQAVVSFDPNAPKTATLDPETDLSPGTNYQVMISPSSARITEVAGVELAQTSTLFATIPQ